MFIPHTELESIRRRAARLTWVTGAIQVLLATCCMGSLWAIMNAPPEQVAAQDRAAAQQIEMIRQDGPALAIGVLVIGLGPGLACLLLGFPLRRGGRGAATALMALLLTQALVTGLMLAGGLLGAVQQGNPVRFTMSALLLGSALGLLLTTFVAVYRARSVAGAEADLEQEPWA